MLNKLLEAIRRHQLLAPGDTVICALSGGADSVAMTFGLYLLKDKLGIRLEAAHYNHQLRGAEAQRDEEFCREFCRGYGIPLHLGRGQVTPGPKGLEAAARDARYGFLEGLPGLIATAHTADDNAETMVMRLVRGTGLKGLGGISPKRGRLIRPMLDVTRQQVLEFLEEYHLPHVEDGSNREDRFLRNRLRHGVMPQLVRENPRLAENLSATAQRLRQEEELLLELSLREKTNRVDQLQKLHPALRRRVLSLLLEDWGCREPDAGHMALVEELVFSHDPSARVCLPGGLTVARCYQCLEPYHAPRTFAPRALTCPGEVTIPELGLRITARWTREGSQGPHAFTVDAQGTIWVRPRKPGDVLRLPGGSKSLKKLFVDRKIPAARREELPVLEDDRGILGVGTIGPHQDRASAIGVELRFVYTQE